MEGERGRERFLAARVGACRGMLEVGLEAGDNCYGLEREGLEEGYISSKTTFDTRNIKTTLF